MKVNPSAIGPRGTGRLVRSLWAALTLLGAVAGVVGVPAASAAAADKQTKTLQLPMRTDGPKSLDPAVGSTQYDNMAVSQIYETLMTFSYADPQRLEPLLLESLPERSKDGLELTFKLKKGVKFHDADCFPGGKGRELVADDVFYSLKRLADGKNQYKNWWLLEGSIKGLDDFKTAQNAKGTTFNYDAPVEGFVKVNDHEFKIVLTKPVFKFQYILTMFQTSIVPREAVENYKDDFPFKAVGTGPFALDRWEPKQSLSLVRNPDYHEVLYPARDAWNDADRRMRLHRPAGQRVPFVDRIEFTMYIQEQPMWLQFEAGQLGYTEVPAEYFEKAFDKRTRELKPEMARRGISAHKDVLLDFIFQGFNMEDAVLGGLSPERRALRQAIHLATDLDEINEAFYNGINVVFDGPIPVALDGYPAEGRAPVSYRGSDLPRARQKLVEAGWPEGRNAKTNEQLVIRYYTSNAMLNQQQSEMLKRQIERLGVKFEPVLVDFSTLIETCDNRKAPMFGFAWGSDYPDAENNLALFYGPYESPGANHFNYKRAEYDALYEKVLTMDPGAERTKIYEQMRDMLIEDCPYVGSMGRTRFYLMAPWIQNCRPTERMWSWIKYLDVDDSKR